MTKRKKPSEPRQTAAERQRLMDQQKDRDEKVFGVRPEIVLDTTADDADWIRDPSFWSRPADGQPER